MELHHTAARSLHLRQSYIEISKYIHTQLCHGRPVAARRPPRCQTQRHLTTSAFNVDKKRESPVFDSTALKEYKASRFSVSLHDQGLGGAISSGKSSSGWARLHQLDPESLPSPSDLISDAQPQIQLYGYITSHRPLKDFDFIQLVDPRLEFAVQVLAPKRGVNTVDLEDPGESSAKPPLQTSGHRPHTPVRVLGTIVRRSAPQSKRRQTQQQDPSESQYLSTAQNTIQTLDPHVGRVDLLSGIEVRAHHIEFYNTYTSKIVADCDTVIPPELRHLQFRTDPGLRSRIRLRSRLSGKIREHMLNNAFDEIETPLLFKSTPEGAREFVVPTRKRGMAYALPQSPQQYKQVLMASGISRYFQFAKCFRDEDMRADRQPEFTQLDLEMSFAGSVDVMKTVEDLLLNAVWPNVPDIAPLPISASASSTKTEEPDPEYPGLSFQRLTYEAAMRRYGSDKPDTRLQSEIRRVDGWLPADVKGMVTSLDDPVVEMMKIDMQNSEPVESQKFFKTFLEGSPAARYATDEARIPGVAVYDPLKPLHGLAAFGHEAAARVEEEFKPEPGDLLILWAREEKAFTGGSTVLGDLRRDIYQSAISQGLISAPSGFAALWVTDFPLFSPTTDSEPGQGGSAGLCSTHHPFTAPKLNHSLTPNAFQDDPLSIIGDHYDLVINGVEVGGGSCRIHRGAMQLCILRDVLKLKPERINDFSHLLEALNAGCPPHAGFALGFDRLMAMLTDSASVRDVIAFPKTADGEDKFVRSPSRITREQLATYHLAIAEEVQKPVSVQISKKV